MSPRPPVAPVTRIVALVVLSGGALLMIAAVFADPLGFGGGQGFGWKQLIAAIVGLVILLAGVAWLLSPLLSSDPDDPPE